MKEDNFFAFTEFEFTSLSQRDEVYVTLLVVVIMALCIFLQPRVVVSFQPSYIKNIPNLFRL